MMKTTNVPTKNRFVFALLLLLLLTGLHYT